MKAFPLDYNTVNIDKWQGMDLRDYFAAKAMEAFLTELTHKEAVFAFKTVAETAYLMADTMMEARNVSSN
jgi:hypothetical protein